MTIFEDINQRGPLFKQLESDGLIRKAFDKDLEERLTNYGYFEGDDENFDFAKLEQIPVYIVFVDEYKRESRQLLFKSYEPFSAVKNAGHFFDFLIIDTEQEIIYGIGLGRKNRLFTAFSENGSVFKYDDNSIEEKLRKNLPIDVVSDFKSTLEGLGRAFFDIDSIPGNEELLQEALDRGPSEEGYYYIEDEDEEREEDEIRSYLADHELKTEYIEDEEAFFQIYFPKLYARDLSTGDY